jgi:hypothetical protein
MRPASWRASSSEFIGTCKTPPVIANDRLHQALAVDPEVDGKAEMTRAEGRKRLAPAIGRPNYYDGTAATRVGLGRRRNGGQLERLRHRSA